MLGSAKGGKGVLELANFGPHDVITVCEHTLDRAVHAVPEIRALPRQVDKGHRLIHDWFAHCSLISSSWSVPFPRYRPPVAGQTRSGPSLSPCRPIQPMRRAGTPAISAKAGTSVVTTEPAAMKQYSPSTWPQTMVALAPIVLPRLTRVWRNSLLRSISARGLLTLVNTQDGPQKTPSSSVTPL